MLQCLKLGILAQTWSAFWYPQHWKWSQEGHSGWAGQHHNPHELHHKLQQSQPAISKASKPWATDQRHFEKHFAWPPATNHPDEQTRASEDQLLFRWRFPACSLRSLSFIRRPPRKPFLLLAKSAWWTLGSNGVESDSVIPAASPRDLELDFPSSLSADRESRTSTKLSPATRLPKLLSPPKWVQHNGKAYISNNQNERKKRTFVKAADDDSRVQNNFFPSQLRPCSIEHDPWSPNVGKYQNGTSYTRVSARHNWDARAPLWVSFSKGFWAKNVLSPSGFSYLLWKLRTIFATFDGVRVPTLFLTLSLLHWKSPTWTATIVVNYLFNKKLTRKLFPPRVVSWNVMSKKRTLQTNIKKENEKKRKKKTT